VTKRTTGTFRSVTSGARRPKDARQPSPGRGFPEAKAANRQRIAGVDFAALFRRPPQDPEDPEDPEDPDAFERPTPRQAAALHACLEAMSEQVRFGIDKHDARPVTFDNRLDWCLLASLPIATWRQKLAWRRRFWACIDDLIGDLEAGEPPIPRCVGEEVALRLAIDEVSDRGEGDLHDPTVDGLPADPDDDAWDFVLDALFQDLDVDVILWPGPLEGLWEDPAAIERYGPADYRPAAWFKWFLNVERRLRR